MAQRQPGPILRRLVTDLDPLAAEPGVDVTVTASAMAVATADLVVLPGSRAAGQPFPGGVRTGAIWGTMWHGAFENDEFLRVWLTGIARLTGAPWRPAASAPGFAERREVMLDRLSRAITTHVDLEALWATLPN